MGLALCERWKQFKWGGGLGRGRKEASYNCQFNSGLAGIFYRNLILLEEEREQRPEVPGSGIPSAPVSLLNQTPGEKGCSHQIQAQLLR